MLHPSPPRWPRAVAPCALFCLAILCAAPASNADIIASSTFDVDDEGWRLSGDPASPIPTHFASGGNPGGFIRGVDAQTGGTWYWVAPPKFRGDVSAAVGGSLSFDLRQRGSGGFFSEIDVAIQGAGLWLYLDYRSVDPGAAPPQNVAWTTYSVPMVETAGWRVNSLSGPAPTPEQFLAVLSGLNLLAIRGEFITGPDNGDLDNVILRAGSSGVVVPEPGGLLLLGLGAAGLAASKVGRRGTAGRLRRTGRRR